MIRDLASAEMAISLDADVCLIGAGTVGLFIADRLARAGLRTIVLESGARIENQNARELNEIECIGEIYRGAEEGRTRGLGGTSQIWGGALIPFLPEEFGERPELGLDSWPVDYPALEPYLSEIESIFRVTAEAYDLPPWKYAPAFASGHDFLPRLAKWPSFSRRNIANLLSSRINSGSGPDIWINATVVDFHTTDDASLLATVFAEFDQGRNLKVSAKKFILCAGAIESTRLMLWLARKTHRPERFSNALGRYFHDHLSKAVAHLQTPNPKAVNRAFGFTFKNRTMRSLRFELSPMARRSHALPGGFCHVSFQPVEDNSIEHLRAILRGLQRGKLNPTHVLQLSRNAPYLAKLLYWLAIRRQLYWPIPSILSVHVVAEQMPRAANCVTLSNRVDRYGVPLARLDWSIDEADMHAIDNIAKRFEHYWASGPLSSLGRWQPVGQDSNKESTSVDIYHPGGSTRMGSNEKSSVVDGNLRVWSMPNLHIVSTSTFPAGGAANPTMTLLLFGLRLADNLVNELTSKKLDRLSLRPSERVRKGG
jgi:choline dehydrogenase-like flavoprotein